MNKTFIAFLPFLFLSVGCGNHDRYEVTKDSKGQMVRLNKETGEMSIISDGKVVPLKSEKDVAQEELSKKSETATLATTKKWPVINIPQLGSNAFLSTSWRDGLLYYQFALYPLSAKIEAARNSPLASPTFIVELYDSQGFKMTSIPIPLYRMSQTVDIKGKGESMNDNNSIAISQDGYSQSKTWNVLWAGIK